MKATDLLPFLLLIKGRADTSHTYGANWCPLSIAGKCKHHPRAGLGHPNSSVSDFFLPKFHYLMTAHLPSPKVICTVPNTTSRCAPRHNCLIHSTVGVHWGPRDRRMPPRWPKKTNKHKLVRLRKEIWASINSQLTLRTWPTAKCNDMLPSLSHLPFFWTILSINCCFSLI